LNAFGIRVPSYDALRTPRYLYVEYDDGERQLYDIRRDPYELTNIVARVPASVRTALSRQLEALEQCHGASCGRIEDRSPPAGPRRRTTFSFRSHGATATLRPCTRHRSPWARRCSSWPAAART
jgi:hypothetical protein